MLEHLVEDHPLVRELTCVELGVDLDAVDPDLEATPASGDELQRRGALFQVLEQDGRQTDGLGLVVSDRAVLDLDPHDTSWPLGASPNASPTGGCWPDPLGALEERLARPVHAP